MAGNTVDVPLKRPFDGADGAKVTKLVLREPTGAEYFNLGHPQTWVRASGGMALIDNDQAIKAYAERCIIEPNPLLAMSQMHLLDAIAVKNAVVGFFTDETPTV